VKEENAGHSEGMKSFGHHANAEETDFDNILKGEDRDILDSDRVEGEKMGKEDNSELFALKDDLPDLEASRVREAALDDKLGVELRSIVEQIQDMQREVADALKDGGEI